MSRAWIHLFAIFLLLGIMVFLNMVGPFGWVLDKLRLGSAFVDRPLVTAFGGVRNFFAFFVDLRDIARQNGMFAKQVTQLTDEVAKLENAGEENRALREALGLRGQSPHSLIPSEVIGFDPQTVEKTVTLSGGGASGAAVGDAVIETGGAMVGVISEVFDQTSQMRLITSRDVVVNVRTSDGLASGVVRGEHGLGLLFDLIAQNETVKPKAKVITSGLGGQFPSNLLIGTVGEIRSSGSELFQKASVVPAANLANLRFVFIVNPR